MPSFRIGRVPVTNGEWRQFIDDGGYTEPRWWSARGWEHRLQAGLTAPQFWNPDGSRTRFGHVEEIPADEPVQHVTFFEAEAYAAWAGARLPTEVEWEKACAWDPAAGARRRYPWGADETLGAGTPTSAATRCARHRSAPIRRARRPTASSRCSVTSGSGPPRRCGRGPGFTPMIYQRYSEPFFDGDYKVLRGGSWAVAADILRPSFRNWDHPIRRQIFSGVRLAWDA